MNKEEAIKYLQQLYPNGGHCWLDEQRIEAIGMAIQALQEEPISEQNLSNVERIGKDWKEEPVSEDFKKFEEQYLEKEKDEIISVYDRHAGLVDGAQWQKEKIINKACKWLEDNKEFVETEDHGIAGWIPDQFINDFRKAIEED